MLRLTSKKLSLIPLIQTFFKVRRLEFQIEHGMFEFLLSGGFGVFCC